ncbi:uncharacterized protein LOC131005941 [Salvia miltiorrhiza]|uniref:uncharacterized protein LOC131005941 n=1 Tax=Salvia miltiorrhiza TaxID=226208 RepID=UPI0025AD1E32|nr:uncharacterized protein LOC131005941 [Salvia miltiorrhiza]
MTSAKIEKSLKSLHDWKLPPSSPSDAFKRRFFFKFSSQPSSSTVKTIEKEIRLSEGYATFPLFPDHLQRVYKSKYSYLQMEMIQVGVKPTKLGSNTSVIISLHDKRFQKFNYESLMGLVESSLCDGPIYFYYFPSHCVHMLDRNLCEAFTVDIKTQGCSKDENVILMYKFHYKPTYSNNVDFQKKKWSLARETTLFLTNIVGGRNRVVSKKIYWDQVSLPEAWFVRNDGGGGGGSVSSGEARVDWKEAAEAHVLKVDVPGFKKGEVRVEVEGGRVLQISGERRKEEEESDGKWHCEERSGGGRFLRRVTMPENAKLGEVKASLEDGVLTVTVPKGEVYRKPEVVVIDISG